VHLIIIRHGHPEWRRPFFVSFSEFERLSLQYDRAGLSAKGAEAVGALAKQLPKAFVLSSDLPRARETAEIIGNNHNVNIEFSPLFRELKAPRVATGLFAKPWAPAFIWSLVHWWSWIAGSGESPEKPRTAWRRAAQATNKILKQFETEDTIILVSHGWFMILLTLHLRWRRLIKRGPIIPKTGLGAATEYALRANHYATRAEPSEEAPSPS
jgi:broad specificity phosphatase PhoE